MVYLLLVTVLCYISRVGCACFNQVKIIFSALIYLLFFRIYLLVIHLAPHQHLSSGTKDNIKSYY